MVDDGKEKREEILSLFEEGRSRQSSGDLDGAWEFYRKAYELSEKAGEGRLAAASLGQLSIAEEARGNTDEALLLNDQSAELFMAAGDAPGLLIAKRARGILLLRTHGIEEAISPLSFALGMSFQMGSRYTIETLREIVGVSRYLQQNSKLEDLLLLGAGINEAIKKFESEVRPLSEDEEMVWFGEMARALAGIFSTVGFLVSVANGKEEPPDRATIFKLAREAVHQAWLVDAWTQMAWKMVEWVTETLEDFVDLLGIREEWDDAEMSNFSLDLHDHGHEGGSLAGIEETDIDW